MNHSIDWKTLRKRIADLRPEFAEKLATLVGHASVSMETERHSEVHACANVAASFLEKEGAEVRIVPTEGLPIVLARSIVDSRFPTVTIYNHLDVQPADPSEWETRPFLLSQRGERYAGRGATDDKGPALVALLAFRMARALKLPINIQFLWESEEEIGSPNFAKTLRTLTRGRNRGGLATDSIVVSDTLWPSAKNPAIPYGLRGLMGFLIRLQTGEKDVHSGTTGGAARNPVGELAALITECYDARTGRVHIPGFYQGVPKPTAAEIRGLCDSGFTRQRFQKAHGLRQVRFARDAQLVTAIMAAPTFEVHGITGGYSGPGVKTIVPHAAEAKLSCRLVPPQRPAEIFKKIKEFVRKRCPEAKVIFEAGLEPYLVDPSGPWITAASQSMYDTFGKKPALTREGGSIGAVVTMSQLLSKNIVLLGLSLPEDGYHAINESFAWSQAVGGIELFVRYFARLANRS
jgi:acetylornithine deacetylase/succinyl-diaminopimelate desuccinylase-like protein